MTFSSNASAQKYYQFFLQEGVEIPVDTPKTLQDKYRGRDEAPFNNQGLERPPERLRSGGGTIALRRFNANSTETERPLPPEIRSCRCAICAWCATVRKLIKS